MWHQNAYMEYDVFSANPSISPIGLIPKVLLSPVGTIWTLDRLVQFQFMLRFLRKM